VNGWAQDGTGWQHDGAAGIAQLGAVGHSQPGAHGSAHNSAK
jgi:hypothetical protein